MISKMTFILLAFAVTPLDLKFQVGQVEDGFFYELPKDKHGDRERGEDSFGTTPDILIVADGIGGVEFTSKLISQVIVNGVLKDSLENPSKWRVDGEDPEAFRRRLVGLATRDIDRLYRAQASSYSYEITGFPQGVSQAVPFQTFKSATTFVAANLVKAKDGANKLRVFQKGDSRVAVFRLTPSSNGLGSYFKLVFVSREGQNFFNAPFSFVWEPFHKANTQQDAVFDLDIQENDLVLVGSDGLFDNVPAAVLTFVVNYLVRLYQTEDWEVGLKDNTLTILAAKLFQKFAGDEEKIQERLTELLAKAGKAKKSGRLRGYKEMRAEMDQMEAEKKAQKAETEKILEQIRGKKRDSKKPSKDVQKESQKPESPLKEKQDRASEAKEAGPKDTAAPSPQDKKGAEAQGTKQKPKLNPKSEPFTSKSQGHVKVEENPYVDTPEEESRQQFVSSFFSNYKPSEYKIDLGDASTRPYGLNPVELVSGSQKQGQEVHYPQPDFYHPHPPNFDQVYNPTELQDFQGQRSQALQEHLNWAQKIRSSQPSHQEVEASIAQTFVEPLPQDLLLAAQQQQFMEEQMRRFYAEEFILQQADVIRMMRMQETIAMNMNDPRVQALGFSRIPGFRRLMVEEPPRIDLAEPVVVENTHEDEPLDIDLDGPISCGYPADPENRHEPAGEETGEEQHFYTPKSHLSGGSPKNVGEIPDAFPSPKKTESPSKQRLQFLSTNDVFVSLIDQFLAIDSLQLLDLETPYDPKRTSRPMTDTDESLHEAVLAFHADHFAFSPREVETFFERLHSRDFCGVVAVFAKLIASSPAYFPGPFYISSVFESDKDWIPASKDDDISLALGAVRQADKVPQDFQTDQAVARLTLTSNQVFEDLPKTTRSFIRGLLELAIVRERQMHDRRNAHKRRRLV